MRIFSSFLFLDSAIAPVHTINLGQALLELANRDMGIISFLDIGRLLLHASLDFEATCSSRVRRVFLIERSIVVVLVLDHIVLQDPHVALVDEPVHRYEHVGVN